MGGEGEKWGQLCRNPRGSGVKEGFFLWTFPLGNLPNEFAIFECEISGVIWENCEGENGRKKERKRRRKGIDMREW